MKKIVCACLACLLSFGMISNTYALENLSSSQQPNISTRTANTVTYSYSFSNYYETPASISSYVPNKGGISITLYPDTNMPKETMTFELVRDGTRTGKEKTVAMTSGKFVSWGELPSGKYSIRLTSSYADIYSGRKVYGQIRVIFGD